MTYAERVRELEAEGLTTSDAQAVADCEQLQGRVFDYDPENPLDGIRQGAQSVNRHTDRQQWAAAITALAAPYSWHTRDGIGAARGTVAAFSGDTYLGTWNDAKGEGWTEEGPR